MIQRRLASEIVDAFAQYRAIVLHGPPRVGRTIMATQVDAIAGRRATWIDLRIAADRSRLVEGRVTAALVVVEGITLASIDELTAFVAKVERTQNQSKFLLLPAGLGDAATARQALTGLALGIDIGGIDMADLTQGSAADLANIDIGEQPSEVDQGRQMPARWLRGGLPESLNAADDASSAAWRFNYLDSLFPAGALGFGGQVTGYRLRRTLEDVSTMQGREYNDSNRPGALDMRREVLREQLGALTALGFVRKLDGERIGGEPFPNPCYYIRDSGLHHALAEVPALDAFRSDDDRGHSWQAFGSETLIEAAGRFCKATYFRNRSGNEIDLVLRKAQEKKVLFAIEFKIDEHAGAKRGFDAGCAVIAPENKIVVHGGSQIMEPQGDILRLPLSAAVDHVREAFE